MKVLVGRFTGRELHAGVAHVAIRKAEEETGLSKVVTEVSSNGTTYLKSIWLTS